MCVHVCMCMHVHACVCVCVCVCVHACVRVCGPLKLFWGTEGHIFPLPLSCDDSAIDHGNTGRTMKCV